MSKHIRFNRLKAWWIRNFKNIFWLILTIYVLRNWEKCISMEFFKSFNGNNILFIVWILMIIFTIYDIKIKDGVDYNTMLFYIGHFKNTPKIYGNICLIAHNRGFMLNYFEKLKFLKIDDEICYMINNKNMIYKSRLQ